MRFKPECAGRDRRIDSYVPPPRDFIAAVMDLAMVSATQWNGELIADFTAESATLCKSEVVGICGAATTNETRVLSDSFDVIPIANPARFRQGQHTLIDRVGSRATRWLPCIPIAW